jgi:hypothetical protein
MARRYDRPWRVIAALALVLAAASLFGSVWLYGRVQDSRRDSVILACKDTNQRNRAAFIYLQAFPRQKGQPKRSRKEQTALIHGFTDALVGPVRQCTRRADHLVK